MASIDVESSGNRRIMFRDVDGAQRSLRLGECSLAAAREVLGHVHDLLAAHRNGTEPSARTRAWLDQAGDVLHGRLEACRLVGPRDRSVADVPTLGAFIDGYLAQRGDVKPGTMNVLRQAKRHLCDQLGEHRRIDTVSVADADAFKAWLIGERHAARSTVAKWIRYARHYFTVAHRRGLIASNPFAHLKGAVTGNPARRVFVPAADVQRIIDVAPDPQWKLLIALGRFGGLRIPSEALALRWNDIDFAGKRFIVRADKTAHHADGGVRIVPMFPELVEHFQRVFDDAPEGTEHVITRYRDPAANLRTQLVRYIAAAGLKPWGKPWQNLRASRATELADEYPSHVAAAWLGHTERIADAFYRQVTDDHFARAIAQAEPEQCAATNPATPKPKQAYASLHEPEAIGLGAHKNATCKGLQVAGLGAPGFEPGTKGL